MKKIAVIAALLLLLILCPSCRGGDAQTTEALPEPTAAATAAPKTGTEPATEADKDEVFTFKTEAYEIKYPKGFEAEKSGKILVISSSDEKKRAVTVTETSTVFTSGHSYGTTIKAIVKSDGGVLTKEAYETTLGGRSATGFSYKKGDLYITGYLINEKGALYIVYAASADKSDDLPVRIAQTIRFAE